MSDWKTPSKRGTNQVSSIRLRWQFLINTSFFLMTNSICFTAPCLLMKYSSKTVEVGEMENSLSQEAYGFKAWLHSELCSFKGQEKPSPTKSCFKSLNSLVCVYLCMYEGFEKICAIFCMLWVISQNKYLCLLLHLQKFQIWLKFANFLKSWGTKT